MNYLYLTDEQQQQVLAQRILELEATHYAQTLTLGNAKAVADNSLFTQVSREQARQQIAETEAALRVIEIIHQALAETVAQPAVAASGNGP